MSQLGPPSLKRKKPDSHSPLDLLTDQERIVFGVIRSKKDVAIWMQDLRFETKLPVNVFTKCLKSLITKNLIKEVVNINKKGKKHYMAAEYEPSAEITGGAWYTDGKLDTECIDAVRNLCLQFIHKYGVATLEGICDLIRKHGVLRFESTTEQIEEIVKTLVLDNEIVEVKSNGMGEFDSIPVGKVCYKCPSKGSRGEPRIGAMASIPCGVCPRISDCTPDGIISPKNCRYYTEWLNF